MVLKKTYAAKVTNQTIKTVLEDGTEIIENKPVLGEQRDVLMHPLEECAIRAWWAIHDVKMKVPPKHTESDEHNWLIEHGVEYVKQKRAEWDAAWQSIQPELQSALEYHDAAHAEWVKHAERCHAHGYDYDTYPDGRNLPLIEKNEAK